MAGGRIGSSAMYIGSTLKYCAGDTARDEAREGMGGLKPRPRNGDTRPVGVEVGLGARDKFGVSSLIIANDAFLCGLGG